MSWVACECDQCFCTAMGNTADADQYGDWTLCDACMMGEHEDDGSEDPEA